MDDGADPAAAAMHMLGAPWWAAWKGENTDRILLGAGAATSLALGLAALARVRREQVPKLAVCKIAVETVLAAFLLAQAVAMHDNLCTGAAGRALAFFTQLLLVGGELCFAAFCIDLLRTITDPFSTFSSSFATNIAAVFVLAAGSAAVLVSRPEWVGETFVPVCYTNTKASGTGATALNLAFLYIPVLACYFLSVLTVAYASAALGTPLAGFDMRSRLRSLRTLQDFVFMHGVAWGSILLLYLPTVILVEAPWHDETRNRALKVAFATFLFLVGGKNLYLVRFLARAYSPRTKSPAGASLRLSKALQRDVLYYMLRGLAAVLQSESSTAVVENPYQPRLATWTSRVDPDDRDPQSPASVSATESVSSSAAREPLLRSAKDATRSRVRELRMAGLTLLPMLLASALAIAMSVAWGYHVKVAVGTAVGIVIVVASLLGVHYLSELRLPGRYRATLKDLAPTLAHQDRKALLDSVLDSCAADHRPNFKVSGGRSGAFMIVTNDRRWIIKTIESGELHVLMGLLPDLVEHWNAEPGSTISRLAGIFTLRTFGRKFHLIVMENILPTQVDATYDLKGSWIDRTAAQPAVGRVYYCKHCSVPFVYGENDRCLLNRVHTPRRLLKDNDFQAGRVLLPLNLCLAYKEQLARDTQWLADHGIMDYSLLLGVRSRVVVQVPPYAGGPSSARAGAASSRRHNSTSVDIRAPSTLSAATSALRTGSGFPAALLQAPAYYHLGLIDYLQTYTWAKRAERFIKVHLLRKTDCDTNGVSGISAVSPREYRDRFMRRVVNELFVELRDLVQVVRRADNAPITTLNVAAARDFDSLWSMIVETCPSAANPEFAGKDLDQSSFAAFRAECQDEELSIIVVDVDR